MSRPGAEFLPAWFPISAVGGDDLAITFPVVDSNGDPWDWTGCTVVPVVVAGPAVLHVAPLVAGSLTLYMSQAETLAALGTSTRWALKVIVAGAARSWLAGPFDLFPSGTPGVATTTGTTLTVGASGAVTLTVDVGLVGAPGVGVPAGGAIGQVLAKNSAADFDTGWVTGSGGGGSGDMLAANNLSELTATAATARTNISAETAGAAATAQAAAIATASADATSKANAAQAAAIAASQPYSAVLAATTASFLTADETKLDGIEALADVTDAANVNAAGAVMESDYNANTVLAATADNTPLPLIVGASTFLGRKATGDISAMSTTEARTLLNVENGATADQTAGEILTALLTVDGAGSGLDADLLDGNSSAAFATATGLSDHLADAADAHDASAISIVDAGLYFTGTDVEAALQELGASGGGGATNLNGLTDVVITAAASGDILRHNGTDWVDAAGATHFDAAGSAAAAQAASQPLDTDLTAIAALTSAADKVPYSTGAGTWALGTFTAAGRALVDDADAAAQRTTLGLGTMATEAAASYLPLVAAGASVENIGAVESNVQTVATTGATETLDTAVYGVFDMTMDQACTFTFSNPAPSGKCTIFTLILRGAFTPTLPASVDWGDASAPTYTTPSMYVFTTVDAGTTWIGSQVGKAFA